VLCNLCATSIPNLHFHCPDPGCDWDLCVRCRYNARKLEESGAAGGSGRGATKVASWSSCPNSQAHAVVMDPALCEASGSVPLAAPSSTAALTNPAPMMEAHRFFEDLRLEILRKVSTDGLGLDRGKVLNVTSMWCKIHLHQSPFPT
jgi:hypothetical protein